MSIPLTTGSAALPISISKGETQTEPSMTITSENLLSSSSEATTADEFWGNAEARRDAKGDLIILSPISIFPKPLGVSYRNFEKYYSGYLYANGERMEVANCLVASMFEFYFSNPKYSFRRLPYQAKTLIKTVHVAGTIYWVVTAAAESKEVKEKFLDEGLGTDDAMSEAVFLLAIVTEKRFCQRPERKTPSTLLFSNANVLVDGAVTITGQAFKRGHVAILGGKTTPTRPSIEFYTFDTDNGHSGLLMPWSGPGAMPGRAHGLNSFSFAIEEAEKVDNMFRTVVTRFQTPEVVYQHPPTVHSGDLQAIAPSPVDPVIQKYLQGYRINSRGLVIHARSGKVVGKKQADETKRLAREAGVTIAPPKGRRSNAKAGREMGDGMNSADTEMSVGT